MFLELDGKGPHYTQLIRALKRAILDGRLAAGARLPPTRLLAQELEMSRTTVLAAYERLRAEGFIQGRAGAGSYVSALHLAPVATLPRQAITPPSRYARRIRHIDDLRPAQQHYDKRYNLQYCNPLVNPALNGIWGRELARAATHINLEETSPQGLLGLRQQICDYLVRRRGVVAAPEDILVVNGTQQAFSLTARVLLDEGDSAVLEEPHYFGVRQALLAHGAQLHAVRTDGEGLVCDELPAVAPRLICVTPSHQFPSGATMSLPRRLELLRYAAENRCWILEDDFDGEFRFDTQPLAALRSLDEGDRVIYVGTFSKTLFGALRLGYMVLPTALRRDLVTAKYLNDFACPEIEQAALAHFMESGGFERHLRLARRELKARYTTLVEALRQHAGDRVEIVDAPAGMYVLVWLRDCDHAGTEALIARARAHGLGLHPLAMHYQQPPPRPGLMFGYARLSVTALREAAQLFARCLDEADWQATSATHWRVAARLAVS
ncbi:PLP-dependent aminotransferase family protein [Rhodanobacter sp. Si-c]|uniref:PLP-dependent aminotransferase family protein n=1 Tax=Rhodanobacter lycopersici TaxID=3162487 RepID=A0ABV3QIT8_9GAMM